MKYKVGDKVKIRLDLHEDENWCGALVDVTKSMLKWAGKVVTIRKVRDNNSYGIREDGGTYLWHESMIQGIAIPVRIGVSEGKVDIKTEETPPKEVAEMFEKTGEESKAMKYKVGDNVQFVRALSFPSGGYIKRGTVWEITALNDTRCTLLLVDGEEGVKGIGYNINSSLDTVNSYCEKVEAKGNDSEEAKTKGSHYERASMQPLEVMQRVMTAEQFEGFLYGCCIKYLLRKDYKGQRESDVYKARQYAYWLEMAKEGRIINPSKDKVPVDYKFNII